MIFFKYIGIFFMSHVSTLLQLPLITNHERACAHRRVDLYQSDVRLLIHIFDCGVVGGAALQLHLVEAGRFC